MKLAGATKAGRAVTPPIDLEVIAQLEESIESDAEFIANLIAVFLRDMDARIADIAERARSGDAETVATLAHSLKGSSSYFGAHTMIEMCTAIETRARRGDVRCAALVARQVQESTRVRAALEEWQGSRILRG